MVSYYNSAAMYRHQQAVSAQTAAAQFQYHHHQSNVHPWYNYHHHMHNQTQNYCMHDAEQQMWQHFHQDAGNFQDYQQNQNQVTSGTTGSQNSPAAHHLHHGDVQLPSPPITVSGSELSSPGGQSGHVSPLSLHHPQVVPQQHVALVQQQQQQQQQQRQQARSPYEWIKKNYQNQPNPGKTRTKDKYRVVYTDHQRVELEKEFYYSRYITIRRKAELANALGLSERQVKIWFQNRRAKERKQVKKREDFISHKDYGVHIQQHQQQQQQNSGLLQQAPQPPSNQQQQQQQQTNELAVAAGMQII